MGSDVQDETVGTGDVAEDYERAGSERGEGVDLKVEDRGYGTERRRMGVWRWGMKRPEESQRFNLCITTTSFVLQLFIFLKFLSVLVQHRATSLHNKSKYCKKELYFVVVFVLSEL